MNYDKNLMNYETFFIWGFNLICLKCHKNLLGTDILIDMNYDQNLMNYETFFYLGVQFDLLEMS